MSEEKVRNYRASSNEPNASDSIPSFLLKTYEILQNSKYSDIICWTKNGEGFVVKKVKEFAQNILPTHFRHSNYTSFVRQLNMYDFHKTRQENQQNAFKNLMFKRGSKHLLKDIQRKDYKKKKQSRQQTLEKAPGLGYENDSNGIRTDKKTQIIKEFYEKKISNLFLMKDNLEKQIHQLASIQQINFENKDSICELIDKLFRAKNKNKDLVTKLSHLSLEWENFSKFQRKIVTEKKQHEENKKVIRQETSTYSSMKALDKK